MRRDRIVERPEPEPVSAPPLGLVESDIAGDRSRLADLGDAGRAPRRAVEVDQQARVSGEEERSVENAGKPHRDLGGAEIPGDVAIELGRRQAEPAVARREQARGLLERAHGSSRVVTLKPASVHAPKLVESATSVASRPRAIRMRPMRGMLCRASKRYHWPDR